MRRTLLLMLSGFIAVAGLAIAGDNDEAEILRKAGAAYTALVNSPDRAVPVRLQESSQAIAVFPGVVKGAVGWGARRGHGVISVRRPDGNWSAPVFMTMTGGSFGLQAGVSKTDLVLFIMNEQSVRDLLANKYTLGA